MLVGQWLRHGIIGNLKDKDVDPVLALLVAARVAEAD